MIMKKISILIVLGIISLAGFSQQQPMYGQYMFNMLNVNPAYAGNRDVGNVNFLIRRQWLGIDGAPTTGSISMINASRTRTSVLADRFSMTMYSFRKDPDFKGSILTVHP